ncbi:hem-containing dehydratase protein [Aspergillus caelatus]|uniref:Hem-containing dehydratase protein n=1 Tax=Aspergillus caelatus TaxID=61420 RepID=A0A5N7A4H0_9EURO|nr:hem-containing dehydratase protein [Aspergillus caelatus]KAE8364585.1 hem-containing dehydratase protein [Aspergillus caelatus]
MYTIEKPLEGTFVYSLFGVQQPDGFQSPAVENLIRTFSHLMNDANCHLDQVTQDGILSPGLGKTRIWIATWKSIADFEAWWESDNVVKFWSSLPPDAGIWREFVKVPYGRSHYQATQNRQEGLGVHFPHKPAEKKGYWGWMRDSIGELSKENRMDSLLPTPPLPEREASLKEKRLGRVTVNGFPDNICFTLERQDLSEMTGVERGVWFDQFDQAVGKWMDDLSQAAPEAGILTSRMCYDERLGTYKEGGSEFHKHNRKIELFYFMDLRAMERLGRSNKGHVALRNNILKTYGPGGAMSECGKMALWVETNILKAPEIDAEYVGCVPGTGFMAYQNHEAFRCQK